MILQSLLKYYETLQKQNKVGTPGWNSVKVSARILLDENGNFTNLVSTKTLQQVGKKQVEKDTLMLVPEHEVKSSGIRASFLCDNSSYLFGIDNKADGLQNPEEKKKKIQRATQCFAASRDLHHQILDGCESKLAMAILHFFDGWNPETADNHPIFHKYRDEICAASNLIFQLDGMDAQNDSVMQQLWNAYKQQPNENTLIGQCLVTGKENVPIALVHPTIKGVRDAQSSGAAIVSFNGRAFESFGHVDEQGLNAPVSQYAAFAYTTALNYLLQHNAIVIGGTTIVFWAEHGDEAYPDVMAFILGETTSGISEEALKEILLKMKSGEPADVQGMSLSPDEHFYILGLAPNAARISIRFFYHNTFEKIINHLMNHQMRMQIVNPKTGSETNFVPFWQLLKATVNPHSKDSASSPLLAGNLMMAVLQDSRYPEAMYQNIMLRVFSDQDEENKRQKITYVKTGFIKAYLMKNLHERWGGKITMAVNEKCKELPYVLGRLFAVLEEIQQNVNPGINATIKDRYFNAACATPANVFPVLLKLSNAHLGKLVKGNQVRLSKKVGSLLDMISMPEQGNPIPNRLSLDEQGMFVLGYYQETEARFTKNKTSEEEDA